MTQSRGSWQCIGRRRQDSRSRRARKLRFAGRGKGKSGGYRVITFFSGADIPVFLLNVFAKGEKVVLTPVERRELSNVLKSMVEIYRAGVKRHIEGRPTHH